MADSIRFVADEILSNKQNMSLDEAIQVTIRNIITKHNRIIFNGNGYSPECVSRAAELGLPSSHSSNQRY